MKRCHTRALAGAALALVMVVTGCAAPSESATVRAYVDQVIDGLGEGYYAGTPEWQRAVDDVLPDLYEAESIEGTYEEIRKLTAVAGGVHSFFSTPEEAAEWEKPYPEGQVPVPTVSHEGEIATLRIPSFSSHKQEEIDAYLEAAAAIFASPEARNTCAWVVDVSANTGGDSRVMLVALSPLLDDGTVQVLQDREAVQSEVVVDGNAVAWGDVAWGQLPGEPVKIGETPIALVQGTATASAGESVIIAFHGQDNVRTFGWPTMGLTTVNDGFTLPDGAVVTLSFALLGDRDRTLFDGPLQPQVSAGTNSGDARSLASTWAAEQCRRGETG